MSTQSAPERQDTGDPGLRLLIMGPPGAGKGTQASVIAATYGIPAISTGDIFRRHVADRTPLGVRAHQIMSSGGYIDDEITNAIVAARLAQDDTGDGFLLDGYPRTLAQVEALDQLLADRSTGLSAVLVLVADPEEVTARLLTRADEQGRADDTPGAVRTRLQVYQRETAPLLDTYRERRLLLEVDANGPRPVVTHHVLSALERSRKVSR